MSFWYSIDIYFTIKQNNKKYKLCFFGGLWCSWWCTSSSTIDTTTITQDATSKTIITAIEATDIPHDTRYTAVTTHYTPIETTHIPHKDDTPIKNYWYNKCIWCNRSCCWKGNWIPYTPFGAITAHCATNHFSFHLLFLFLLWYYVYLCINMLYYCIFYLNNCCFIAFDWFFYLKIVLVAMGAISKKLSMIKKAFFGLVDGWLVDSMYCFFFLFCLCIFYVCASRGGFFFIFVLLFFYFLFCFSFFFCNFVLSGNFVLCVVLCMWNDIFVWRSIYFCLSFCVIFCLLATMCEDKS